jgi:hypothetical protein
MHTVSPEYDTYVLLKSRIGEESSYQEDSIQKTDKSTVTSREGFVYVDQIPGQKSVQ